MAINEGPEKQEQDWSWVPVEKQPTSRSWASAPRSAFLPQGRILSEEERREHTARKKAEQQSERPNNLCLYILQGMFRPVGNWMLRFLTGYDERS